jgi:hypothetical protein
MHHVPPPGQGFARMVRHVLGDLGHLLASDLLHHCGKRTPTGRPFAHRAEDCHPSRETPIGGGARG